MMPTSAMSIIRYRLDELPWVVVPAVGVVPGEVRTVARYGETPVPKRSDPCEENPAD